MTATFLLGIYFPPVAVVLSGGVKQVTTLPWHFTPKGALYQVFHWLCVPYLFAGYYSVNTIVMSSVPSNVAAHSTATSAPDHPVWLHRLKDGISTPFCLRVIRMLMFSEDRFCCVYDFML